MFLASDLGGYAAVVSSVLAQYDAAKSDPRRGAEQPNTNTTRKGQGNALPLGGQNSGASGVRRYRRGLPSASTSMHMPPELSAQ